jgi:hypothetical protein
MWQVKEVTLRLFSRNYVTGGVSWDQPVDKQCRSKVLGNLAVTNGPKDDQIESRWWVMHISLSQLLCELKTETAAMKVAETLWNRCASLLLKPTPKEVIESLPLWVKPWLRRCQNSGRYEDP